MNLKAKRLVRTTCSEQYALFDLDRTDRNFDPLSVGKLDLHYTSHGIYGTLLFWEEACDRYSWNEIRRLADALMAEFNSPMGVPAEYAVELFNPSLSKYELLSNIPAEGGTPTPITQEASSEQVDMLPTDGNWAAVQLEAVMGTNVDSSLDPDAHDERRPNERREIHRRVEWQDDDS